MGLLVFAIGREAGGLLFTADPHDQEMTEERLANTCLHQREANRIASQENTTAASVMRQQLDTRQTFEITILEQRKKTEGQLHDLQQKLEQAIDELRSQSQQNITEPMALLAQHLGDRVAQCMDSNMAMVTKSKTAMKAQADYFFGFCG